MDSPLGPVLANIFMDVELEREVLPTLEDHMLPWKRYVDDTISWIKNCVELVTESYTVFIKISNSPTKWKTKGLFCF